MNQVATAQQTTQAAAPAARNDQRAFRAVVTQIATSLLSDWVGAERAGEAVGRVASALSSAAASAKKPEEFYNCTQQSIGAVVAISALTGIMPSVGANALAYAIPRRPRKDDPPQLTYQLSHRGLAAIAKRAGMLMVPVPIGYQDLISVDESGSVDIKNRDLDNPPATMEELRGVVVVIRDLATGFKLFSGWAPKKIILARRDGSDAFKYAESEKGAWSKDSDPWHKWPIEMAMKTAMHYAVARGWCVIDDTSATRALSMDVESERVVEGTVVPPSTTKLNKLESLTDRLVATEQTELANEDPPHDAKGEIAPQDHNAKVLADFKALLPTLATSDAVKEASKKACMACVGSEQDRYHTNDLIIQFGDARCAELAGK